MIDFYICTYITVGRLLNIIFKNAVTKITNIEFNFNIKTMIDALLRRREQTNFVSIDNTVFGGVYIVGKQTDRRKYGFDEQYKTQNFV